MVRIKAVWSKFLESQADGGEGVVVDAIQHGSVSEKWVKTFLRWACGRRLAKMFDGGEGRVMKNGALVVGADKH